jgi:flagellar protein FlaG
MPTTLATTAAGQAVRPVNSVPPVETAPSRASEQRQGLPDSGKDVPFVVDPQQKAELSGVVEQINKHVQSLWRDLEFSVDQDSKRVVVKVRDAETGEVIRQIPPEEALSIAKQLSDTMGLIFQARA